MHRNKGETKIIVTVAIALVIFYLMYTTLIAPYFSNAYEYGFGNAPCNKDSSCTIASTNLNNGYCIGGSTTNVTCASCNTSTGYGTFLNSCNRLFLSPDGKIVNGTHCFQCTDFGFKTVSTGLLLFIFVIGIISFAVAFLQATKFGKK